MTHDAFVIDGRYAVFEEFASGGMASVHFGLRVEGGRFSRPVAIKILHPSFAKNRDFVEAFLDEARTSSRVRHPNVVQTVDVVVTSSNFYVVMDYVDGASLSQILRATRDAGDFVPFDVVSSIFVGALDGLHAAHETKDEQGRPMNIVHRDVSPQNFMIGADGVARVLDFGIAKAEGRAHVTREGQLKGKIAYMAPERLHEEATRASDVYSAGVCLWEALTVKRLFDGDHPSAIAAKVSAGLVDLPSRHRDVPPELEAVVMKALARDPADRWRTAAEMARAIEAAVPPAGNAATARWIEERVGDELAARRERLVEIERGISEVSFHPSAELRVAADEKAPARSVPPPAPLPIEGTRSLQRDLVVRSVLGGVALAAVIATGFFLLHATGTEGPSPQGPAVLAPLPTPSAPVSPTEPESASADETIELPDPSATTTGTDSTSGAHVRHRRPPNGAGSAAKNCNPPYEIDDQGLRHYKKECFSH